MVSEADSASSERKTFSKDHRCRTQHLRQPDHCAALLSAHGEGENRPGHCLLRGVVLPNQQQPAGRRAVATAPHVALFWR